MADKNERYYWIKLRTDFFDMPEIDWLFEQKNGCEYIVLYQRLCTLAANTGGDLIRSVGEMIIPYDAKKISDLTKFKLDTVIVALELFKKCKLIMECENGIISICNFDNMVGSESKWADKKRQQRDKLKDDNGDNVPKLSSGKDKNNTSKSKDDSEDNVPGQNEDIVRQEIRDKSIDIRSRDKEINIYNNAGAREAVDKAVDNHDFVSFWESYPKKSGGKNQVIRVYSDVVCAGILERDLLHAAIRYAMLVRSEKREDKFIKSPYLFLAEKKFLEYVPTIDSGCQQCGGEGYVKIVRTDGSLDSMTECACRKRFEKVKAMEFEDRHVHQ